MHRWYRKIRICVVRLHYLLYFVSTSAAVPRKTQEIQVLKCVNNGKWSHQGVWMSGSDKLAEIFHSTQSGPGIMGHHDVIAPTIYCRWERRLWKTLQKATNRNQMLQMFHRLLERPPGPHQQVSNHQAILAKAWHHPFSWQGSTSQTKDKSVCAYIYSYLFQRKYWFTSQSFWIINQLCFRSWLKITSLELQQVARVEKKLTLFR